LVIDLLIEVKLPFENPQEVKRRRRVILCTRRLGG